MVTMLDVSFAGTRHLIQLVFIKRPSEMCLVLVSNLLIHWISSEERDKSLSYNI